MTGTLASWVLVRSVMVLDRFASDHIPLYVSGIRVEICPYDTSSGVRIRVLEHDMGNPIHEKERLEVSPYTVLPPPEIEDRAKPLEKMRQKRDGSVDGLLRAVDD